MILELVNMLKSQLLTGSAAVPPKAGTNSIIQLPLHIIRPNPNQPRHFFDHDSLKELSESIRQYGVIQPVTVRKMHDGTYELVAGERRLKACGLAGMLKIPAIVIEMEDDDSAIVALVENIQRQNLSFLEEANAYAALLSKHKITQEELAKRLGKTQSAIANKIRLLKLPGVVRELIKDNKLTERHARSLLRLDSEEKQLYALKKTIDYSFNVKQTEALVDKIIKSGIPEEGTMKKPLNPMKDIRVFFKTVSRAVSMMNDNGIEATAVKDETDLYYEYVIRIPKQA